MANEKEALAKNYLKISDDEEGQRLDNFLITRLKSVPKSHVYKIIRKGEIRVNKKRVSAFYKILAGDIVRLPPNLVSDTAQPKPPTENTLSLLQKRIIYEDEHFIILNKPSGMSVHAGSTVRIGIIEAMRHLYPKLKHLELAHRLDSETSGCLVLAKKKKVLRELHQLLREGKVTKIYWALTKGHWQEKELRVELALHKTFQEGGKHVVRIQAQGKSALTVFKPIEKFNDAALVEAKLYTGRTHQIRVHATAKGHPLAGDDRYGDSEFNKKVHRLGLKRMFLHAKSIEFTLPSTSLHIRVEAPLDKELEVVLQSFRKIKHANQMTD